MGRSDRVRVGCLFGSGRLQVKYVRVGYGFGSGKVQVRIYFGSIMFESNTDSVEVWVGSILIWMCYGNSVRVGYGFGPLWVGEIRFNIRVNFRSGANWVE